MQHGEIIQWGRCGYSSAKIVGYLRNDFGTGTLRAQLVFKDSKILILAKEWDICKSAPSAVCGIVAVHPHSRAPAPVLVATYL